MDALGWLICVVFFGLMVCGIVKVIEWRIKKMHKQVHSKESDNE